jgi:hypothetical protein
MDRNKKNNMNFSLDLEKKTWVNISFSFKFGYEEQIILN